VYLQDSALAATAVMRSIVRDIAEGCAKDAEQPLGTPSVGHAVDKGLSNVEFVLHGNFADAVEHAVVQLSERERISTTSARATLLGSLDDLCVILRPFRSP
jgi:hypothetical protein